MWVTNDVSYVGAVILYQVTPGRLQSPKMVLGVVWREANWLNASAIKGSSISV